MLQPRLPSPEVTGLIERIRKLVAEQRELDRDGGNDRQSENSHEIARLQRRLARVVKSELTA
jgi:hypothetical protein